LHSTFCIAFEIKIHLRPSSSTDLYPVLFSFYFATTKKKPAVFRDGPCFVLAPFQTSLPQYGFYGVTSQNSSLNIQKHVLYANPNVNPLAPEFFF
jgi:hypothetical protein